MWSSAECASSAGYVPDRIPAGTLLLHRARLRHRGLWNRGWPGLAHPRFMLQLNVGPLSGWQDFFRENTAHGQGLWGEIHAERREAFGERLREVQGALAAGG